MVHSRPTNQPVPFSVSRPVSCETVQPAPDEDGADALVTAIGEKDRGQQSEPEPGLVKKYPDPLFLHGWR
jgi:hypothetical protein